MSDYIIAIAGLWKLFAVCVVTAGLWFLRGEIKALAQRFTNPETGLRVRHGDTEVQVLAVPPIREGVEMIPPEADDQSAEAPALEGNVETVGASSDVDFGEILKNRDLQGLEKWYAWSQDQEKGKKARVDLDAIYLWLRSDFGDTEALAKLREMTSSEDIDVKRSALQSLGYALRTAGEYLPNRYDQLTLEGTRWCFQWEYRFLNYFLVPKTPSEQPQPGFVRQLSLTRSDTLSG